MARRRVEETAEKPSAAERTLDMFADKSPPLGTTSPEEREKAIAQTQKDAIARIQERAEREKRAFSEETGAVKQADIDAALADEKAEREAIQAESNDTSGLGPSFFGGAPGSGEKKAAPSAETIVNNLNVQLPARSSGRKPTVIDRMADEASVEGEEVSCTKGEEMYGKPGQFSTYRVGPFSGTTKVLPGETRNEARHRLMKELNEFADEERENAKKKFLAHYPNAFSS